jgi:hypothetical protein
LNEPFFWPNSQIILGGLAFAFQPRRRRLRPCLLSCTYYVPGCGDLSGSIGVERTEIGPIADDWQSKGLIAKGVRPNPAASTAA